MYKKTDIKQYVQHCKINYLSPYNLWSLTALVLVAKVNNGNSMIKLNHTKNVMNIDFIVNLMDYIVIRPLNKNIKQLRIKC